MSYARILDVAISLPITPLANRPNPAQYVISKRSFLPNVRSTSRSRKESLMYHVMPDRYRLWFAAGSNEFATDGARFDIRRRTRGGCERKQAKRSA